MVTAPHPLPAAPARQPGARGPAPAHDWARVYLTLTTTGPTLYDCTQAQARACNSWAVHHHSTPVYYRQAPGGLVLSLTPTQPWRVADTARA